MFEMAFMTSNADMLNVEETTLASMPRAECIRDSEDLAEAQVAAEAALEMVNLLRSLD